jgi:hypothetical protein
MNEIQIIQQQLAIERLHFAEVANTFASSLDEATLPTLSEFTHACAEYFAFAVAHLGTDSKSGAKLTVARAAEATGAVTAWRGFIREFNSDIAKHFSGLHGTLTPSAPITQWRALSRIDADSIFAERALYEQVRKTLPSGITLAALGAFLP